jgi:RNA polymerase sigma-70 factor (ECF subfamily)
MNPLPNPDELPERLLESARAGDAAALGQLLELYRNYLRLLAGSLIRSTLRVRMDASDLIQETFLEAYRDFEQFDGQSEGEVLAWLRRILARNLADQVKHHQRQGRDWHRQESLEALLDRSSAAVQQALGAGLSSPSAQASKREQAVLVADALEHLPPDYRAIIMLRHVERLKFEEIARHLGRSAGAVRMLWTRALERLSRLLEVPP